MSKRNWNSLQMKLKKLLLLPLFVSSFSVNLSPKSVLNFLYKVMKFYFILSAIFLSLSIVSCSADPESDGAFNEFEEMNELLNGLNEPSTIDSTDWHNYFEIAVPAPMQEMNELNPAAIAQFGYVEEVAIDSLSSVVKEHYLIVLMELKSAIEGYPVQREIDAMSYRDDAINALLGNGNSFKNLTVDPEMEKLHGLDCVRNELSRTLIGSNGEIVLYYQLAIVEGENAFYQILTWCIDSQRDDFEYEMEKIINSFKEI